MLLLLFPALMLSFVSRNLVGTPFICHSQVIPIAGNYTHEGNLMLNDLGVLPVSNLAQALYMFQFPFCPVCLSLGHADLSLESCYPFEKKVRNFSGISFV